MKRNISKRYLAFACLIFFLSIALSAEAATVTWTGAGAASNPANWSGGAAPQYGDDVIFDRISSNNCTWDIPNVEISSLKVTSAYTGKITKAQAANLTIRKGIVWSGGGTDNLASNSANWADGVVPQNGSIITFDSTSTKDCTWDVNITPASIATASSYTGTISLDRDLNISGNLIIEGGALNLNYHDLDIDGYIIIGAGGSLIATSSTIALAGDWLNAGLFSAGTSTLLLNGANQTIYGSSTFYNLQKTVTTSAALYFNAGYTQTITNILTLTGSAGNLLTLASTAAGQQWKINPQGISNLSYVYIADSYNISFVSVSAINSVDGDNNTGISFGGNECVQ